MLTVRRDVCTMVMQFCQLRWIQCNILTQLDIWRLAVYRAVLWALIQVRLLEVYEMPPSYGSQMSLVVADGTMWKEVTFIHCMICPIRTLPVGRWAVSLALIPLLCFKLLFWILAGNQCILLRTVISNVYVLYEKRTLCPCDVYIYRGITTSISAANSSVLLTYLWSAPKLQTWLSRIARSNV